MPVLKSYTNDSSRYIHASVRGAVVTFQTTRHGVEKLAAAGVQTGVRFPLRLLADLTRIGDACTHRGGVEFYEAEQFEFDFKESQESEALFPACAATGAFDDLHLVAHAAEGETRIELLAPSARAKHRAQHAPRAAALQQYLPASGTLRASRPTPRHRLNAPARRCPGRAGARPTRLCGSNVHRNPN